MRGAWPVRGDERVFCHLQRKASIAATDRVSAGQDLQSRMSVFTNSASGAAEQAGDYVGAILGLLGSGPDGVLRETPAPSAARLQGIRRAVAARSSRANGPSARCCSILPTPIWCGAGGRG